MKGESRPNINTCRIKRWNIFSITGPNNIFGGVLLKKNVMSHWGLFGNTGIVLLLWKLVLFCSVGKKC